MYKFVKVSIFNMSNAVARLNIFKNFFECMNSEISVAAVAISQPKIVTLA